MANTTRDTKETLLRRIAYLESNNRQLENEAQEAKNKLHDMTLFRDQWKENHDRERADHILTVRNLQAQARIAGVLAVGGKTSQLPQLQEATERTMSAGCDTAKVTYSG